MSLRRTNNSLYEYLRGAISNALPLEYAIRASETLYPIETAQLRQLHNELNSYWLSKGYTQDEIEAECLLDFSWDAIQLGFPLVRRHSKKYHDALLTDIRTSQSELPIIFESAYNAVRIPTLKYFRACDLLQGNDILPLFKETMLCLENAKAYGKSDMIDPRHLPSIFIREPIRLHPAMTYVQSSVKPIDFGVLFELNADISTNDFIRQIQEFIYQFAVYRSSHFDYDDLSHNLIQAFLKKDFHGSGSENQVERVDGFASLLSGLYSWDLRKRQGLSERDTFDKVALIYDKSDNAMTKNYKIAGRLVRASMARISKPYSQRMN